MSLDPRLRDSLNTVAIAAIMALVCVFLAFLYSVKHETPLNWRDLGDFLISPGVIGFTVWMIFMPWLIRNGGKK